MKRYSIRSSSLVLAVSALVGHSAFAAPGDTTLISARPGDHAAGNAASSAPRISRDGAQLSFDSLATDLAGGDTDTNRDLFVLDRNSGVLSRFPNPPVTGGTAFSYSDDLRFSVYNIGRAYYLRDASNSTITQLNANAVPQVCCNWAAVTITSPVISADSRYVLIAAAAPGGVNGGFGSGNDLFVHDQLTQSRQQISVASDGTGAVGSSYRASLSDDGRYVAFDSLAENLVPGDTNRYDGIMFIGGSDIFLRDRQANTTSRVSVATAGSQANAVSTGPVISPDGRYIAFHSYPGPTEQGAALVPGESRNGMFLRDRQNETTVMIPSVFETRPLAFSADGRFLAFSSVAADLAPNDTNGVADVFTYDFATHDIERVSVGTNGSEANGESRAAALNADGSLIAFASLATNLAAVDSNGVLDVFLHERSVTAAPRIWRSYDVRLSSSSPQASVSAFDGTTAALEFYESTADGGVAQDLLLGSFSAGAHPDAFNHASKVWSAEGSYPYAGSSDIGRGADAGETNAAKPLGVRDLQLHPANNAHLMVAAFIVPENGIYSASQLGVRRTDANGDTVRLRLFNSQGVELASLQASNDQAWVRSNETYDLGTLAAGDRIYFGVDADGGYDYDATEISWEIRAATASPQVLHSWDSYDRDDLLPVDYYESADVAGVAPGTAFTPVAGSHPDAFNHLESYSAAGNFYPYAGRSSVPRGSDDGESNAPAPLGTTDIQLHPPANGHWTVAAFRVTQAGSYSVSGLGVRRVAAEGTSARLHLLNTQGVELANLQATNDRAWVRSSQTYPLGTLQAGDSVYFAVDADGDFDYDATEIAWNVSATAAP